MTFSARGLTLIELILVITIIGVIFIPLLLTYSSYRTTQALYTSAEAVANHTTSAHIFAREAKDQKEWGIKNTDLHLYSIFSSGIGGEKVENNYSLEPGISFAHDFTILFKIGTGGTARDEVITLRNTNGKEILVSISTLGTAEVVEP